MKNLPSVWLLVVCASGVPALASEPTVPGRANRIRLENEMPGTTEWMLTKIVKGPAAPLYAPADEPYDRGWRRRKEVEGYCSHTSLRAGERLAVYVSTDPPAPY
jgi:hypothetical protein